MTGLVTGILLLAGAVLLLGLALSIRSGRRSRAARAARAAQPRPDGRAQYARGPANPSVPVPSIRVSPRPAALEERLPFAEPGLRGRLFHYGGDGPGFEVEAPYAVIDVETTGFSPATGDRIVEIAIARVDARGRIEDEYSTVLNPGRDVGPVFVHGISNSEVQDAPRFEDVAGELLARMDGAIVVAHNAVFDERFLTAEFDRAGIAVPVSPAVCSLWLARRTMRTANHKLTTLARAAGLSTVHAHAALADVRTVAALLPQMLALHGEPLRYLTGVRPMPQLPRDVRPKPRAAELRDGHRRVDVDADVAPAAVGDPGGRGRRPALSRRPRRRAGGRAHPRRRGADPGPAGRFRGSGRRAGRCPARPVPPVPPVGRARGRHPDHRRDPAAAHRPRRPWGCPTTSPT